MILFASLLFAQAAVGVADMPGDTALDSVPVVVVEQRLPAIQATVGQRASGGWYCALSGSTGSAYVDDRLCQATTRCTIRATNDPVQYGKCMQSAQRNIIKRYRKVSTGTAG